MQAFHVDIDSGITGRELLTRLGINEQEVVLLAVNGEFQQPDGELELQPGDEVAVYPPIDGG